MKRSEIQKCIRVQRAWREGEKISYSDAMHFCKTRWDDIPINRVKDACRDLISRGEAVQVDASRFRRHDTHWLRAPWRTQTNEELGIE